MKKLLKKIMVTGVALASLFAFTGCPGAAPEAPETPEVPVVDQRTKFEKKFPALPDTYIDVDSDYYFRINIYKDGTYEIEYTENGKRYKEKGILGWIDTDGEDKANLLCIYEKTLIKNDDGTFEETDSVKFGELWITAEYQGLDCYWIFMEIDGKKYRFV